MSKDMIHLPSNNRRLSHTWTLGKKAAQGVLLALVCLLAAPVHGAVIDFRSDGSFSGTGFGNAYVTPEVRVTAWANRKVGNGQEDFVPAQVSRTAGGGLGVCDDSEGLSCSGRSATIENNDTITPVLLGLDFILLEFSSPFLLGSLTISGEGADGKPEIWGRTGAIDLSSTNLGDFFRDFVPRTRVPGPFGITPLGELVTSDNLSALFADPIDWLLVRTIGIDDAIGLVGVNSADMLPPTPVPLPPVAILFGTGLIGLLGYARRKGLS